MFATLLGLVLAAAPQIGPAAAVEGRILDGRTGAPVAGATVTLGETAARGFSGEDGGYGFASVPPGPVHLRVERIGYESRMVHLLVPRTGGLRADVALEPRPVALPSLVVTGRPPIRGIDPADTTVYPDRGIAASALRSHPTLSQPDAFRGLAGGEVAMDPEAAGGVHVRGGASDQTVYLLDGIPVLNPYHAAGLFSAWNPDALAGVALRAAAPSAALPDALSGVIEGRTLEPGRDARVQAALTTADARVTLDGPAGPIGYLVSWRAGLPASALSKNEPSYLAGETSDLLAKLQADALGGELHLLHYESEDEVAAAAGGAAAPAGAPPTNAFDWSSRSTGVTWSRAGPAWTTEVSAWTAATRAGATWDPAGGVSLLRSRRQDDGLRVGWARSVGVASAAGGVRLRRTSIRYGAESERGAWRSAATLGAASLYGQVDAPLGPSADVRAGAAGSAVAGRVVVAPRARIRWRPADGLETSLSVGRHHQLAQSLRNDESPAGRVFPADLFAPSLGGDLPLPRSDQVILALSWHPLAGVRAAAQAYRRWLAGVATLAPGEDGPFAADAPESARAWIRGASVEVSANGARYGFVASYGWQRVRVESAAGAYTPRHGASHLLEAGVLAHPSATASLRLSVAAEAGRPATPVMGPFEWEACNLLDQGCEFAGSPRLGGPRGSGRLPTYVRVDFGARKHWHVDVRDRDVLIGLFGTVSNVLGRRNVLVWLVDPETGGRQAVEMLPRAPLVVGVDLRR